MRTTVYLVRHAQARPLPTESEPEWALSEQGARQAIALVPVLAELGIRHVYSSPFRRSVETLQPFSTTTGLPLVVHEGLRERCLSSQWIGDFRDVWQRSWADFSYALEGGESCLTCRERMVTTVGELVRRHRGETIAVGSHGFTIALFLTSLDRTFGGTEASALRTPEILRIVHEGNVFEWDRSFKPGEAFDRLATHFRATPGITA